MADRTSIEWTDATWTPVKGCTRASEGCRNCYAEIMAARFSGPGQWGEGLATIVQTPAGKDHRWTGAIRFDEAELLKPLSWRRPRKIFVCSTADLFHEGVTDEQIDRVFAVMALCPQHTFQVLTKRSARMRAYMLGQHFDGVRRMRVLDGASRLARDWKQHARAVWQAETWPLPNVWLGVSAEDQPQWDKRTADLRETPAAIRWVSAEPLLSNINMRFAVAKVGPDGRFPRFADARGIDWVVAGGESGPGARPLHPDWVRSLRLQCAFAGVPFLFKQWGDWAPYLDRDKEDPDWRAPYSRFERSKGFCFINRAGGCGFHGDRLHVMQRVGKGRAGRTLDGVVHDAYPAQVAA